MHSRGVQNVLAETNTASVNAVYFANTVRKSLTFPPGRVAQSVGHLTRKSGVLGSIPGLATYFLFSFHFFKKGSCQLLAKVCARSTGQPLRRSSLPRKSVVRLTDRPPDMTLDVYRGRKTTIQQQQQQLTFPAIIHVSH